MLLVFPPVWLAVWVGIFVVARRSENGTSVVSRTGRQPNQHTLRTIGHVLCRDADRLTVRPSWPTYVGGLLFGAAVLFVPAVGIGHAFFADPPPAAGGPGPAPPPGVYALGRRLGRWACLSFAGGGVAFYAVVGYLERRRPLTFDRRTGRVYSEEGDLCRSGDVRRVRRVLGAGGRRQGPRAVVWLDLRHRPVEVVGIVSTEFADQVAVEVADFLSVPVVFETYGFDRWAGGRPGGPGFPVVLPPPGHGPVAPSDATEDGGRE